MKKYRLACSEKRNSVDLRNYQDIIFDAVSEVLPKSTVIVEKDYYMIVPPPSKGEAISIGKKICKSNLNQHCITINKLFCSEDFDPKED